MGARDSPAHDSAYDIHTAATRTDDGRSDRSARLARDDAFHILRDDGRRAVLRFLLSERGDGPTPLSTLAAFVAAVKYDADGHSAAVGEVQERVRLSLHHSHLPLLEAHDVVRYNLEERTVEPRPLLTALAPFLGDGLDAEEDLTVDEAEAERRGYRVTSR